MVFLLSTASGWFCIDNPGRDQDRLHEIQVPELLTVDRTGPLVVGGNKALLRMSTSNGEVIPIRVEGNLAHIRVWPSSGRWPDGPLQLLHDRPPRTGQPHETTEAYDVHVMDRSSAAPPPLHDGWTRQHPGVTTPVGTPQGSLRTTVRLAAGTMRLELEVEGYGIVARERVAKDGEHVNFELFRISGCGGTQREAPLVGELTVRLVGIDFDGRRSVGPWQTLAPSAQDPALPPPYPSTLPRWTHREVSTLARPPTPVPTTGCSYSPVQAPQRVGPAAYDVVAVFFAPDGSLKTVHQANGATRIGDRTWTVDPLRWPVSAVERNDVFYLAGNGPGGAELQVLGDTVQTRVWGTSAGHVSENGRQLSLAIKGTPTTRLLSLDPATLETMSETVSPARERALPVQDDWLFLSNSGYVGQDNRLLIETNASNSIAAARDLDEGIELAWVSEGYSYRQRFGCSTTLPR